MAITIIGPYTEAQLDALAVKRRSELSDDDLSYFLNDAHTPADLAAKLVSLFPNDYALTPSADPAVAVSYRLDVADMDSVGFSVGLPSSGAGLTFPGIAYGSPETSGRITTPAEAQKAISALQGVETVKVSEIDASTWRIDLTLAEGYQFGAYVQLNGNGQHFDRLSPYTPPADPDPLPEVEDAPGGNPGAQGGDSEPPAETWLEQQLRLANKQVIDYDGGAARRQADLNEGKIKNVDTGELDGLAIPQREDGTYHTSHSLWLPRVDGGTYGFRFDDDTVTGLSVNLDAKGLQAAIQSLDGITQVSVVDPTPGDAEDASWLFTVEASESHILQLIDLNLEGNGDLGYIHS